MARRSEHIEQSQFFGLLRAMEASDPRLKGAFAIPNGFLDTKSKRIRAWEEGVLSGVPDIFLPYPSRGHHGLFLEFKSEKGRVTQAQQEYLNLARSRGYRAEVVFGLRHALEVLGDYLRPEPQGTQGTQAKGEKD